ncbi:transporter substrate-binding domain-containing protein [Nitrincola sp. MINF-07-Sa-05]|uniref:transporter substrate-binding domain-containing protein n=1 Tax=Nitrincola salilacus TaxID=3400273 RepID=UPI003917E70F
MKKLIIGLALAVCASGTAMAQDRTVRIGTEGAYPPYNFINDNGEVDGFERELGDRLCEMTGFSCTWVTNDWDTIIPNLVSGNYDAIMAGMSITDARKEMISFTQRYKPGDPSSFVALAGADESVMTGVVAAQSNTIQSSYLADTTATLVEFPTPEDTIAAMRNGEVDAVLANSAFLTDFVNESGGELVFVGEPLDIADGVGMGLRKSDDDLREAFDAAIKELEDNGELQVMLDKWFK